MPTDPPQPAPLLVETSPAPGRTGSIVLARHAEPALSRKVRLTARQYGDWWGRYEEGGILPGQTPPEHLKQAAARAHQVFTSTRLRSIETARALVGERAFASDPVFIEAPLPPPPWPDAIRLSPKHWGAVSRFWWWFGGHGGQESRAQAQVRAREAARRLDEAASRGQDVLVVAHGFFNTMIGIELKRIGWRCVRGRGWKYWSTRYYEKA